MEETTLTKADTAYLETHGRSKASIETLIKDAEKWQKLDIGIGLTWFAIYAGVLITYGFTMPTIAVLVVGMLYFGVAIKNDRNFAAQRKRKNALKALL